MSLSVALLRRKARTREGTARRFRSWQSRTFADPRLLSTRLPSQTSVEQGIGLFSKRKDVTRPDSTHSRIGTGAMHAIILLFALVDDLLTTRESMGCFIFSCVLYYHYIMRQEISRPRRKVWRVHENCILRHHRAGGFVSVNGSGPHMGSFGRE
jgi:hypothetical protein